MVKLRGGRVTAIEPALPSDGARVVSAAGRWVTPGFIDLHTHYDAEVEVAPALSESVRHGVTTVVLGSCSLSMAVGSADDLADMFCRVEAIPDRIVRPILRARKDWNTHAGYLDHLDGKPAFDLPAGDKMWEACRLEALARSMMDGLAVWSRELSRPRQERSPTVLLHESNRSKRLAGLWELEIDHPFMRGELNMAQVTLACALGLDARNPDFRWRPGHPNLSDWFNHIAARPAFAATAPPSA